MLILGMITRRMLAIACQKKNSERRPARRWRGFAMENECAACARLKRNHRGDLCPKHFTERMRERIKEGKDEI